MPDRVTLVGWTQTDIDAAIAVHRGKQTAARARGDESAAADHEGWINRLLDARPYHRPAA